MSPRLQVGNRKIFLEDTANLFNTSSVEANDPYQNVEPTESSTKGQQSQRTKPNRSQASIGTTDRRVYRPTLILCPTTLVEQWGLEIRDHWKDFNLFVFHGHTDGSGGALFREHRIYSRDLKGYPQLDKIKPQFRWIFDQTNSRASRAVLLTSYETWATRSTVLVRQPKKDQDGNAVVDEKGHQKYRNVYSSRFQGAFENVICDEAHRIRNPATRNATAVRLLRSGYMWLVTATPMLNSRRDMVGLLHLLWRQAWRADLSQGDRDAVGQPRNTDIYEDSEAWPRFDPKMRILLDPLNFQTLCNGGLLMARQHYSKVEDIVCLRRSHASQIPHSGVPKGYVQLRSVIKRHFVEVAHLQYRSDEAAEQQFWHLKAALKYEAQAKIANVENQLLTQPAAKEKSSKRPPAIGPLRELALGTTSLILARLHHLMQNYKRSTLVNDMIDFRTRGLDYEWLAKVVWRPTDPDISSKEAKIKFLTYGSPALRWLCRLVQRIVCGKRQKLLVLEQTPISVSLV